MKTTQHWPKHFFLIGNASQTPDGEFTRENMGSKAFNLLRMSSIGLPVPQALVIGTHYTKRPDDCLLPLFSVGLPALEAMTAKRFGDPRQPLIVSVRSGAPVSMPGMMETLLNVGLCESTLPGLLRQTGNPRLVWDAYRRLIATYGEVVAGLPGDLFESELEKTTQGKDERLLDFSVLRDVSQRFLELYLENAGHPFPQDVRVQLGGAVKAVYESWFLPKAKSYRKLHDIDKDIGTAVTIQRMVFGNSGSHSGAGVGFTRNPTSGEKSIWVDFLANAQGEDVVAGQRNAKGHEVLTLTAPQAWSELQSVAERLEHEFLDMQDFEFTVEDGALYMLQTRAGKRTPMAATRIAIDMFDEKLIDAEQALTRTDQIQDEDLSTLQRVTTTEGSSSPQAVKPLAEATSACNGVTSGSIALDSRSAKELSSMGKQVILVRQDAQTSDIEALEHSAGLLTQRGARTSHAAVVARQMNKVCLVACQDLHIDTADRCLRIGEHTLSEGDVITLDGNDGLVFKGSIATIKVPEETLLSRLHALRVSQSKSGKLASKKNKHSKRT